MIPSTSKPKSPRDIFQPFISFAFVEFGMSRNEWLSQTPDEWQEVMDAWLLKERRLDRRTARICMVIAGGTEDDYMPHLASENREQTIDEMCAVLSSMGNSK